METQVLVSALKKALKLKGINYQQLGEMLGITERSITRTFGEGTITVSRLLKILEIIDFSLHDLESLVGMDIENKEHEFTPEQDRFLADHFEYFLFYLLIFQKESIEDIVAENNLDEGTLVKILSKLDQLNLIEWLPGNKVKVLGGRKYSPTGGSLFTKHTQRILTQFVENSFASEKTNIHSAVLNLSEAAQKKFEAKMDELFKEVRKEMEIERMLNVPSNIIAVYLGIGSMDFIFEELRNFRP